MLQIKQKPRISYLVQNDLLDLILTFRTNEMYETSTDRKTKPGIFTSLWELSRKIPNARNFDVIFDNKEYDIKRELRLRFVN